MKEQKRITKKKRNISALGAAGAAAACMIVILSVLNIIIPDKEFSEKENRVLAQFPKISWTALSEGTFSEAAETYVADQFAGRDVWIRIRSEMELALGKYEANGIYKGDDGYFFEETTVPEDGFIEETAAAVRGFAGRHGEVPVTVLVAPNAANILSEKLPAFAPVRDQNPDMDQLYEALLSDGSGGNISTVDLRETFRAEKEGRQLYYRTDHHWTTRGAYLAFQACGAALGIDPSGMGIERYALTHEFCGSMISKSGFPAEAPDTIETFIPFSDVSYVVAYTEEGEKASSVYRPENLEKNDKYTVFFGGNYPQIDIRTTSSRREQLLVIKDSYANCFVPFLIPYYSGITMIDPRYYNGDIDALMKEKGIDRVLFLFNANTFFQEKSIADVLQCQES